MLNLFQHPYDERSHSLACHGALWTLKRVQGDGISPGKRFPTLRVSLSQLPLGEALRGGGGHAAIEAVADVEPARARLGIARGVGGFGLRAGGAGGGEAVAGEVHQRVGEAGVWCGFEGWRFLHWFEGNPDARRIHLVNRAMDRPDGSVIDLEDTDSFIDMREPLPPGVVRAASNSAWPQGPEGVPEGVKVIGTLLDVMPIVFKAKRKFLALSRSRSKRTLNVERDVVVDGIP